MRPLAWRVGAFALVGVMVLVLTIILIGGKWFAARERAVLHFNTSVYGLQVGAPVVFRGVRVGQVVEIRLAPLTGDQLLTPVTVELQRSLLNDLLARNLPLGTAVVPLLVEQGLVARLATQSLLTGLLYIDLDLRSSPNSAKSAEEKRADADAKTGLPLIPTEPNPLQNLKEQLEGINVGQIAKDAAAMVAGARALVEDPATRAVLSKSTETLASIQALAQSLQQQIGPVARDTQATLGDARRALGTVDAAAAEYKALAQSASPLVAELTRTSTELTGVARTLGDAVGQNSELRLEANRALQDVARASRSLRELSEMLQQHPDSLIRGRAQALEELP